MIVNNLPGRIKFKQTDDTLTNNISLLGVHGLATRLGLLEDLGRDLHGYQSNRAFENVKYPCLQILSHSAGGVGLEDTRKISADISLCRLLFPEQARTFEVNPGRRESYFPAPNTLGSWYRNARFRHAGRARKINRNLCGRIINQRGIRSVHIDIDSKMHASCNKKAKRNRDGIKGYAPLYATIPSLKLVLDPLFRPGNTAPAKHNASMTRTILKWVREVGVERVEMTLDNAGCQVDVMKAVDRARARSEKQIYIYTRPASPDEKISKKMFKSIKQAGENWKPIKIYYENNRKKYRYLTEKEQNQRTDEIPVPQILDADYTLSSQGDSFDGRLILIRQPVIEETAQKAFAHGWRYYPVLTNDWEADPIEIPGKYNQRGAGEDSISEIVQDGEAERFPCQTDAGNALYLVLCSMGHNLDQAMKILADQTFNHRLPDPAREAETDPEDQQEPKTDPLKKPAHQEAVQLLTEKSETEVSWLQFTIRKFKHLLLSIPARITKGERYRHINISSHDPFGGLLEKVIRACWNPDPLVPEKVPP